MHLIRSQNVSDLLRKTMVVSKKLSVSGVEEWLNYELYGCPHGEDAIPQYREVKGVVMVRNPYHGWQQLHFGNAIKLAEELSKRKISQPIGELVAIVENEESGNKLQVPFPEDIKNNLMEGMEIAMEPSLLLGSSQIYGVLDSVRNKFLDWALELEVKGIIGDGMSFSNEEKKAASQGTYQITNNIGSMDNSQLQQASTGAMQSQNISESLGSISEFIGELKQSLNDLELNQAGLAKIAAEVSTIESQLRSPKPKENILRESLGSVRTVLEGATDNLVAVTLLSLMSHFP